MTDIPNVVIVSARCARISQLYCIRFEETNARHWTADWAFAVREALVRKEGYDKGQIAGTFAVSQHYPGCPYCGAASVFKCICGKVGCWDQDNRKVRCPWCSRLVELRGEIESLRAGEDR